MSKLWQLKKLSDGSALNEPQPLPENWGPIFGLAGIQDQLADLGWLGEAYNDMGWFVVGDAWNLSNPAKTTADADPNEIWDVPLGIDQMESSIGWPHQSHSPQQPSQKSSVSPTNPRHASAFQP